MGHKILAVEDDVQFQLMIQASLKDTYELTLVSTGQQAFEQLAKQDFDLFIIDWMLEDIDGLQICSYIKSQVKYQQTPVIILTGKDGIDNLTKGFHSGADDYMTKPFHLKELQLRVEARLRGTVPETTGRIFLQGLTIDQATQKVRLEGLGQDLELTRIEFKLLSYFATHIDHVLSRSQILDRVWPDNLNVTQRTVDSHISNLRKKLSESNYKLEAVQGVGYRFSQVVGQKVA